ncbi:hypothetical protein ACJX0J_025991 [Zea mays]
MFACFLIHLWVGTVPCPGLGQALFTAECSHIKCGVRVVVVIRGYDLGVNDVWRTTRALKGVKKLPLHNNYTGLGWYGLGLLGIFYGIFFKNYRLFVNTIEDYNIQNSKTQDITKQDMKIINIKPSEIECIVRAEKHIKRVNISIFFECLNEIVPIVFMV